MAATKIVPRQEAAPIPPGGGALQVLAKVDATDFNTSWVTQSGLQGGVGRFIASDTEPTTASDGSAIANGDVWYNSLIGRTLMRYQSTWVETGSAYVHTGVIISASAPVNPAVNQLWLDI